MKHPLIYSCGQWSKNKFQNWLKHPKFVESDMVMKANNAFCLYLDRMQRWFWKVDSQEVLDRWMVWYHDFVEKNKWSTKSLLSCVPFFSEKPGIPCRRSWWIQEKKRKYGEQRVLWCIGFFRFWAWAMEIHIFSYACALSYYIIDESLI